MFRKKRIYVPKTRVVILMCVFFLICLFWVVGRNLEVVDVRSARVSDDP